MATIQEAAQFNTLAYYITGKNEDGTPQFESDTPEYLKTLPDGWTFYVTNTEEMQEYHTYLSLLSSLMGMVSLYFSFNKYLMPTY